MVICQHIYKDSEYKKLMELTYQRHKDYCFCHGFEYYYCCDGILEKGDWYKVSMIQELLNKYNLVIYIDADAMIYDLSFDLSHVENPPDTIGAVIFPERRKENGGLVYRSHYNVGALYIRNGERVKRFIEKWLSLYPGKPKWYEQQVFNEIADETIYPLPYEYNHTSTAHPVSNKIKVKGYHSGTNPIDMKRNKIMEDLHSTNCVEAVMKNA